MLRLRDIHYTYPDWPPTLQGASLDVDAGESVFLLGPSGSGKSTLLRVAAGLLQPGQGTVELGGEDVTKVPTAKRRVGMLFQEPALFPHLDVAQNVGFGLRYLGVPRPERRPRAMEWLELVGLANKAQSRVDELSGGQRQRVALARTLAAWPLAVLLDEPLASLDRDLRDELGLTVRDLLHRERVPALWVTHDRDEADRLGDRVLRLHDGQVTAARSTAKTGSARASISG